MSPDCSRGVVDETNVRRGTDIGLFLGKSSVKKKKKYIFIFRPPFNQSARE
jgi:hypothetical protein